MVTVVDGWTSKSASLQQIRAALNDQRSRTILVGHGGDDRFSGVSGQLIRLGGTTSAFVWFYACNCGRVLVPAAALQWQTRVAGFSDEVVLGGAVETAAIAIACIEAFQIANPSSNHEQVLKQKMKEVAQDWIRNRRTLLEAGLAMGHAASLVVS